MLEYASDLFDEATVETLGRRLIRLLEAAVADAGQPLGSLPILEAAERDTILRTWNDTAQPVAAATLPALFAAQAARTPDAVAVVFEDRTLTYAALDAHANRLAHHLQSLGVGPETMVGLCVERSPEMVIGLLGILKAGGAYLPLDPNYPRERLGLHAGRRRLPGAGDAIGAARSAARRRCPALPAAPPSCGSTPTGPRSRASPAPRRRSTSIRAIRPTSSTPRAPPERQRASSSSTRALPIKCWRLETVFEVGSDFRSALFISSSFDASIEQTLLPFTGGGAAVVISDDVRESPSQFWHQLSRDRVTFMSCVPSYLESILQQAPETASLQHLALGGEALTLQFKNKVARHLQVAQITNLYGPTEATIDAISLAVCRR